MDSLQSLDAALFHFVNVGLKNRFFDWVLPFFSWNSFFVPTMVLLAIWLTCKCGARGRLLVFFLLLTLAIGDGVIIHSLKGWIGRPRPYAALDGVRLLIGRTTNPSMPSGHAANWFAAATVAFIYYRRSVWFMLPLALIVAFSRIYLGVHYPSDVLAGSVIAVAYALLIVWGANALWRLVGQRLFPIWWTALPSLPNPTTSPLALALNPNPTPSFTRPQESKSKSESLSMSECEKLESTLHLAAVQVEPGHAGSKVTLDQHWLRLAYVLIGLLLIGHLAYLASGMIQLSEDEAYQWLWSKHLALSYYSKPPLIAYTQFLGTTLWGDTQFGVRFFAPVLGAITSLLLVRFLARQVSGFVACASVLASAATPLLMVGATLLTIDSLSVLFWVAAVVSGWQAVQRNSTRAWLWTGLWMGCGFLGKYTALFQWLCWAVFFVLWRPARAQLRRPGPYLALLINALCSLPVLIWNAQHQWVTVVHLADRGGLDKSWQPTLRYFAEFVLSEFGLLNPIFFLAMIWAAVTFWKRLPRNALLIYLFSMGAPLFLVYFFYTVRARVQPNWIAPSVLPLFCLFLVYWDAMWRSGADPVKSWFAIAVALGLLIVVPLHDTRLIGKLTGIPVSWKLDPLTRVLGWKETADAVNQARSELLAEGKPVFLIASHYGTTSLLTFYTPEAKAGLPDDPLVYCESSAEPNNQFYFWPGYQDRHGQNALYIAHVDSADGQPPARLLHEFASVRDLGTRDIVVKDRFLHRIHLFACRNLR